MTITHAAADKREATVDQSIVDRNTAGELLHLLEDAGYDPKQTHPGAYQAFSWKTFAEKLRVRLGRKEG